MVGHLLWLAISYGWPYLIAIAIVTVISRCLHLGRVGPVVVILIAIIVIIIAIAFVSVISRCLHLGRVGPVVVIVIAIIVIIIAVAILLHRDP